MNSIQTRTHRVEPAPDGRFAVITPEDKTLALLHSEALALMVAASLDAEPVRVVCAEPARPRWDARPTHFTRGGTVPGRVHTPAPTGSTPVPATFLPPTESKATDPAPERTGPRVSATANAGGARREAARKHEDGGSSSSSPLSPALSHPMGEGEEAA